MKARRVSPKPRTDDAEVEARQRRRRIPVRLLTRLLAANLFTVDELADCLVVDPRTIGRYLTGEIEIPIDRQVCLARLLIERVPPFARQGRNLLGQISASIEYANSKTETHNQAPVPRSRTF